MRVTRSQTHRFVAAAAAAAGLLFVVTACTDGGGDAPSFTTTQSSQDDSTPTSDVYPSTPERPNGDDSEIGNGDT